MAQYLRKKLQNIDFDELFKTIRDARWTSPSGEKSFSGEKFFEAEAVLCSVLDVHSDIRGTSRERIKAEGIREACKEGPFDKDSILEAVKRAETEHLRKPFKRYVVLGNVSIDRRLKIRNRIFRADRIRIAFSPYRPTGFEQHLEERQFFSSKGYKHGIFDKSFFRISVWSRTAIGAITRALGEFDLLRAFWNMTLTRRQQKFFVAHRETMNAIIIGPFYTVHTPRGKLAGDAPGSKHSRFWFEPGYCYEQKAFYDSFGRWPDVEREEQWYRRKLQRLPADSYRERMITALTRYVRALDTVIWDDAALRLWSILELLCGRKINDNFEVVIKRTAGLYENYKHQRHVLEYLRQQRNDIVHDDRADSRSRDRLQLLKSYVEQLIDYHLAHGRKLGSFEGACQYLELPALRESAVAITDEIGSRESLFRRSRSRGA